MIPEDTTPEAFAVQAAYFRRLGGPARLLLMLEMCDAAREITAEGVRRRHPDFDAGQVRREVLRIVNELAPQLG